MKIEHHYGGLQKQGYEQPHAHHMTNCLNDKKDKKLPEGGSPPQGSAKTTSQGNVIYERSTNVYGSQQTEPLKKEKSSGDSLLKNLWDALGDETTDGKSENGKQGYLKEHVLPGVLAAVSGFRDELSSRITNKWEAVKESIKVNTSALLKRFGRETDSFTALSDEGTASRNRNPKTKMEDEKPTLSHGKKEEVSMKPLVSSHLMDSYSKTGAYCQLGENITYQKPERNQRQSQSEREVRKDR